MGGNRKCKGLEVGGQGLFQDRWTDLARASSCTWEGMGRGTSCRACQHRDTPGWGRRGRVTSLEAGVGIKPCCAWALDWSRPWPFLTGEAGKDPQAAWLFLWCILEREHSALKHDSESHSGPRGMDRVPCAHEKWYCRG